MSRKRFTTLVVVVLLLGAAGLVSLYVTLGRMNAMVRTNGQASGAEGAPAPEAEKVEEMTLTPAGEAQLHEEQERAKKTSQAGAPAQPPPAPASKEPVAAPPPGASGSSGR